MSTEDPLDGASMGVLLFLGSPVQEQPDVLTFSVQIDLEVQADSLDYVEEMTAELEQVISSHFDEEGLLEFDYEIVQREEAEEPHEKYED